MRPHGAQGVGGLRQLRGRGGRGLHHDSVEFLDDLHQKLRRRPEGAAAPHRRAAGRRRQAMQGLDRRYGALRHAALRRGALRGLRLGPVVRLGRVRGLPGSAIPAPFGGARAESVWQALRLEVREGGVELFEPLRRRVVLCLERLVKPRRLRQDLRCRLAGAEPSAEPVGAPSLVPLLGALVDEVHGHPARRRDVQQHGALHVAVRSDVLPALLLERVERGVERRAL
mmetsp:Transcript_52689/g.146798  ORF Transcript_52689/g.146798 Transcript_52689/m.146798 type:complete len:227 (-) Transcript_52689:2285-2965(-)